MGKINCFKIMIDPNQISSCFFVIELISGSYCTIKYNSLPLFRHSRILSFFLGLSMSDLNGEPFLMRRAARTDLVLVVLKTHYLAAVISQP